MIDRYQNLILEILHKDPAKPDQSHFFEFQPEEWEDFITTSIRYRVANQLNEFLAYNSDIQVLVPYELMQKLKNNVQYQLYYNFSQYKRLRRILHACEKMSLPVILFKGLWLVEHVYRDPKARLSGDIDLLIRPEDMEKFTGIAREIDCIVPEAINNLQLLAPESNEYPLAYENNETIIDVHWLIEHPDNPLLDETSIWMRSEETTIGGSKCRTLGLEDNLLYLCFHAAIHHKYVYVGPRALLDIALLINNPPRKVDWDAFIARSQEFGWSRGVWLTLDLIREHLGEAPPDFVLAALQPDDLPSDLLREKVMETLFLYQMHKGMLSRNAIHFIEAPWHLKPAILLRRLLPKKEEVATQLNVLTGHPNVYLNYPKRVWFLIRFHALGILQSIINNSQRMSEIERSKAIDCWLSKNK